MKAYCTVWFFILGSCLASHASLIACRLPKGESIVSGRSHCEGCGRPLTLWDVFPVFGWLMCCGRCRTCGYRIPALYPLLELLLGTLSAYAFVRTGAAAATRDALVLFFGLALAIIDSHSMIIPNELVGAGAVAGLIVSAVTGVLVPSLEGGILCGAFMCLFYLLAKGDMGGGDVKFAAMLGVFLGPWSGMLAVVAACILGGLTAIVLVGAGKWTWKQVAPLAPFMFAGMVFAIQASIINAL